MKTIILPHGIWSFDISKKLGKRGGFGSVFQGHSKENEIVAIKEIPSNGEREIKISDGLLGKKFSHIIEILDAGQDTETGINYVVMKKAEKSLKEFIDSSNNIPEFEIVNILIQIVDGLLEVPHISHRDLKPANILFENGSWKIADFGISKFLEESTSTNTYKDFLSPEYASPEQWRNEKLSNSVDIYALGCIIFSLATGSPPFSGSFDELEKQHLFETPSLERIANLRLRTLAGMMLRKNSITRPSLGRIREILEEIQNKPQSNMSEGSNALSKAAALIEEKNSNDENKRLSQDNRKEERRKIANEAKSIIKEQIFELYEFIQKNAPNSNLDIDNQGDIFITLGVAGLNFDLSRFGFIEEDTFKNSKWDVINGVIITLEQNDKNPYVFGANLWYTNQGKNPDYRWLEISYMTHPLLQHLSSPFEPFAIDDLIAADLAASPIISNIIFGSTLKIIDDENKNVFFERWAKLFAKASVGNLSRPTSLPITD